MQTGFEQVLDVWYYMSIMLKSSIALYALWNNETRGDSIEQHDQRRHGQDVRFYTLCMIVSLTLQLERIPYDECQRRYSTRDSLIRHMRNVHELDPF